MYDLQTMDHQEKKTLVAIESVANKFLLSIVNKKYVIVYYM